MRYRNLLFTFGLTALAGCHVTKNIAHNVHNEPSMYWDGEHVVKELRKEARAAFCEVKRQYPRRTFGDDFHDGFIDGYSDYLDKGGKAEMPAMPPNHYRRAKFLNPEGHARIKDYFLGFKYGMDVAIATGCRPFYTTPILMTDPKELPNLDITVLPPPPDVNAPMPTPGPIQQPSQPMQPKTVSPKNNELGNPVKDPAAPSTTIPVPNKLIPDKSPDPIPAPKAPGRSAMLSIDNPIAPADWKMMEPNASSRQPMLTAMPVKQVLFELPAVENQTENKAENKNK
jgi:hypothetical protein